VKDLVINLKLKLFSCILINYLKFFLNCHSSALIKIYGVIGVLLSVLFIKDPYITLSVLL